jgi:hypothetical protein
VLGFLSVGSRRIEFVACTRKPDAAWMLQQARNLLMELDDRERRVRFLIHDGDAKFPRAFDALLASEQITVILTPIQAPNAIAHMERWVGTVRRECLDRLLIVGRRQLAHILRVYVRHYNRGRPHRVLDLKRPEASTGSSVTVVPKLEEVPRAAARPARRPHSRIRARHRSLTTEFLHPTRWRPRTCSKRRQPRRRLPASACSWRGERLGAGAGNADGDGEQGSLA